MKKTCETCKYWGKEGSWLHGEDECRQIASLIEIEIDHKSTYSYGDGYVESIWTKKDFGCKGWEKASKQKNKNPYS